MGSFSSRRDQFEHPQYRKRYDHPFTIEDTSKIFKFRFLGEIGAGGLGTVYHVKLISPENPYLKIPSREFALKTVDKDEDPNGRFERDFENISFFSGFGDVFRDNGAGRDVSQYLSHYKPGGIHPNGRYAMIQRSPPIIAQSFGKMLEIENLEKKLDEAGEDEEDTVHRCYLLEYCDFTLDSILGHMCSKNIEVSFEFKLFYLLELLEAVFFMKKLNIFHRDLNPLNVMFYKREKFNFQSSHFSMVSNCMEQLMESQEPVPPNHLFESPIYEIRILDFDRSKQGASGICGETSGQGHRLLTAPEILHKTSNEEKYGSEVDTWTLGMLCMMVMLELPLIDFYRKYHDLGVLIGKQFTDKTSPTTYKWSFYEDFCKGQDLSKNNINIVFERWFVKFVEDEMVSPRERRRGIDDCFSEAKNIFRRVLINKTLLQGPMSCSLILERVNQKCFMQFLCNEGTCGAYYIQGKLKKIYEYEGNFKSRGLSLFDTSEEFLRRHRRNMEKRKIKRNRRGFSMLWEHDILLNLHSELGWDGIPQNNWNMSTIALPVRKQSDPMIEFAERSRFRNKYCEKYCRSCNRDLIKGKVVSCQGCSVTHYCSVICKEIDYFRHKPICGDVKSDSIRLTEFFSNSTKPWERVRCCGCCQRMDYVMEWGICSRCKKQWYCSRRCQVIHWPFHKKLCKDILVKK